MSWAKFFPKLIRSPWVRESNLVNPLKQKQFWMEFVNLFLMPKMFSTFQLLTSSIFSANFFGQSMWVGLRLKPDFFISSAMPEPKHT
jgi:hypothetical protein